MINRTLKTIASILLAMTIIIMTLPFAMAAETSGKCGYGLVWTFDEKTATLTISGTGDMDNYEYLNGGLAVNTVITTPWHEDYEDVIEKIVVEEGVTSIGECAFMKLWKLTNVSFPSTLERIENYAFWNSMELTSVKIPGCEYIGECAFYECNDLESVTIEDGTTEIRRGAFAMSGLVNVTIPESVTTIEEGVFAGCDDLKNVYYIGSESDWGNIYIEKSENTSKEDIYENLNINYNSDADATTVEVSDKDEQKTEEGSGSGFFVVLIVLLLPVVFIAGIILIIITAVKKKKQKRNFNVM